MTAPNNNPTLGTLYRDWYDTYHRIDNQIVANNERRKILEKSLNEKELQLTDAAQKSTFGKELKQVNESLKNLCKSHVEHILLAPEAVYDKDEAHYKEHLEALLQNYPDFYCTIQGADDIAKARFETVKKIILKHIYPPNLGNCAIEVQTGFQINNRTGK